MIFFFHFDKVHIAFILLRTCHPTILKKIKIIIIKKNWEGGGRWFKIITQAACQSCVKHPPPPPPREWRDKWSRVFGIKVHFFVQQCVFACVRVCVLDRKRAMWSGPPQARTTTSQQHREVEQGRGQGSHQQAQTTAHQSVSAQTPQAS